MTCDSVAGMPRLVSRAATSEAVELRRAEAMLKELIRDEAVIAIHGPRSVGKSTVLRRFAAEHAVEVIDLDDLVVRDAVAANPTASVSGGGAAVY